MGSKLLRGMLVALLVVVGGGGAMAQGEPQPRPFGWPWDEWRAQVEARAVQAAKPLPKVVRRGLVSTHAVALTFDDGFDPDACASIAETLRQHDAVGTFFINGLWLQQDPDRWREILAGMEVANHTRSHRRLTDEPRSVIINQIRSNEYIHESLLGRPMLKVLRPPYGAYDARVGRIAKELGYDEVVMWNVDTGDWKPRATAKRIVSAAIDAPAGSIILMHCSHKATAKALPEIVRHYEQRGIELTGLSIVLKGARASKRESDRYGE
jgi:peptidoglycan-N-acetylglucosamine deacetylase